MTIYSPPTPTNWHGRSSPNSKPQYWHEIVQCLAIENLDSNLDFGLLGYVCDEGVRRNYGRVGAAEGPQAIRLQLAKLPIHFEHKQIADFGDVVCEDGNMEACQNHFADLSANLIRQKICPIGLGGGHDIAYAHFKGIIQGLDNQPHLKIGIVNFDAHFDLRPLTKYGHSGTPFRQILTEFNTADTSVNYFIIGIQLQSNPKSLFDFARQNPGKIGYIPSGDCVGLNAEAIILDKLLPFIAAHDYLYISVDLDGFASSYAPGVSAPSVFGFDPYIVLKTLRLLLQSKKVIALDVAELNPKFDNDHATAKLTARIIDYFVISKPISKIN